MWLERSRGRGESQIAEIRELGNDANDRVPIGAPSTSNLNPIIIPRRKPKTQEQDLGTVIYHGCILFDVGDEHQLRLLSRHWMTINEIDCGTVLHLCL